MKSDIQNPRLITGFESIETVEPWIVPHKFNKHDDINLYRTMNIVRYTGINIPYAVFGPFERVDIRPAYVYNHLCIVAQCTTVKRYLEFINHLDIIRKDTDLFNIFDISDPEEDDIWSRDPDTGNLVSDNFDKCDFSMFYWEVIFPIIEKDKLMEFALRGRRNDALREVDDRLLYISNLFNSGVATQDSTVVDLDKFKKYRDIEDGLLYCPAYLLVHIFKM